MLTKQAVIQVAAKTNQARLLTVVQAAVQVLIKTIVKRTSNQAHLLQAAIQVRAVVQLVLVLRSNHQLRQLPRKRLKLPRLLLKFGKPLMVKNII